jgi:hypothetical protein
VALEVDVRVQEAVVAPAVNIRSTGRGDAQIWGDPICCAVDIADEADGAVVCRQPWVCGSQ